MRFPRLLLALAPLVAAAGIARADDLTSRLDRYESEARTLSENIPPIGQRLQGPGSHSLIDAEVAYQLGDYDGAALQLFDLAQKEQGQDKEAATYYLAESLYQKGDLGTAREYYAQLTANGVGKYRVPALQRIIEIAITQHDESADTQNAVAALQGVSGVPSVPYVLGKHAYAKGELDNAISLFETVQKGSDYELQAEYYKGATFVAKKDLARATDIYAGLIERKPKSLGDRRVVELAQMALARIYYEREQPAKSIDSYLLIDRHSDLFPDALYEVSWVYVKSKQYDKALRALELLEASDPNQTKTPTVRILEGNLRIRKAQMLRQEQINGTINNEDHTTPAEEYDKAAALFTQTHDQYLPAYQALVQMVSGKIDPGSFVDQIAGRSRYVFQLSPPVPEAAAQMLRDEPNVQVFDDSENDLGEIQADLDTSQAIIARLEAVVASGDRMAIYPALSGRRSRIAQIQDDLIQIRSQLADQANDGGSETMQRRQLVQGYTALGGPEQAFSLRVTSAQEGFDSLEDQAIEIGSAIDSAQAIAVALRKWGNEGALHSSAPLADDKRQHMDQEIDTAAKEAQSIEDELAGLRQEISLGKDLSGLGDAQIVQARAQRTQVRAAEDAEQRALAGRGKSSSALDRATRLSQQLDQLDQQLDQQIARGVEDIKAQLVTERQNLAAYRTELAEHEKTAHDLGSSVLGASFVTVKNKLDDIVTRTDVGNVDVAWSQKEDVDDDVKRVNLARSRELKQLKDEFKDILQDMAPKAPPKKTVLPPPPSPEGGTPDSRVNPGGTGTGGNTQPSVKPDEQKAPAKDPKDSKKPAAPKKGGNK